MNKEEKDKFLNNLKTRYPRKTKILKEEKFIEFWTGDRGSSIHNNLLDGKEYQIPLKEPNHIFFQNRYGIMEWIPNCPCVLTKLSEN